MATIFTKIITGEFSGHFVWRDERVVAFLSIKPLKPGHVLVVPVAEVDHWIDLAPDLHHYLFHVARRIGIALNNAYRPNKVAELILGLEVPHCHIHLVPIETEADIHFGNAQDATDEELASEAERIRASLRELGEVDDAD